MKTLKLLLFLLPAVLLCACSALKDVVKLADASAEESFKTESYGLPLSDNADSWTMADFTNCFDTETPTKREEYVLEEGITVTMLRGAQTGSSVFLVAGIHGDETAGWRAGNLLKTANLTAGTLYIISPANPYGAEKEQRETKECWDLNRHFPGSAQGSDAERTAAVIYGEIKKSKPSLVLDLHEEHEKQEKQDFLGNSIICQSLDGIEDIVWQLLLESENGMLGSSPLTLYGSPPEGSINRTVTENLGIPTITIETLCTQELAQRVKNHLEIVQRILQYYGMAE